MYVRRAGLVHVGMFVCICKDDACQSAIDKARTVTPPPPAARAHTHTHTHIPTHTDPHTHTHTETRQPWFARVLSHTFRVQTRSRDAEVNVKGAQALGVRVCVCAQSKLKCERV